MSHTPWGLGPGGRSVGQDRQTDSMWQLLLLLTTLNYRTPVDDDDDHIYIYIYIGYPTGLKKVIHLFGFKYRKSTGTPLRAKTRGNDAA
jgi:hypothetical protein